MWLEATETNNIVSIEALETLTPGVLFTQLPLVLMHGLARALGIVLRSLGWSGLGSGVIQVAWD